ncbi:DNA methyltransferase [Mycobacterium sp. E3251]|uniref:site-specific DNA-methyltransferase n=1 Tax=Mycobacterium sp. E3251 TaxID=1834144 RepID=UPI0007FEF068|nr:DNA methyltransferase [Mycobacterium sp. E3251]OBG96917.1 DNA methyltransferase [Mycobacterium sp. E3251]
MSRLNDLLRQLKEKEPQLARDLEGEVAALADRRAFGLNFERHVPEVVELPGRSIRKGDKVRILPPRGKSPTKADEKLWRVANIDRLAATASLAALGNDEIGDADLHDLVVAAEFRDPIYPGLVSTGKVERGGDKPYHILINAENYHALETLLFTHRGKVDAIYIDPPYNTGAKDWKYNNDYVESDDLYRHSKWLAFMERRLLLAKELLNPNNSVLVVTIDEKEVHRLGLLLEQTFPEARLQMVTITINHRGVARNREFTRVNEYACFLFIGDAGPALTDDDLLTPPSGREVEDEPVRWERLIKGSNNARRIDRPNLFYPVFVDPERPAISGVGDPIPLEQSRNDVDVPEGLVAVWPLSTNGAEKRWQLAPATLRQMVENGTAKVGSFDRTNDRWSILYLNRGQLERISRGEIEVVGRDENNVVQLRNVSRPQRAGMSVWNRPSHNAGYYGSGMLASLIPDRKFPFPKSLYAVEDAVRFAVGDKRHAIVVDFFAGSGTTAHAVARLNHQDGGRRQCISVTNNEVAADQQATLRADGLRPGDADWERWGICDHITRPRIGAAITGRTPDGERIAGDYKFKDEFPMADGFEENAEFFILTYEAPLRVASDREFGKIASLLWMRAGAQGRRIEDISAGWDVADTYGVLGDLDCTEDFLKSIAANENVTLAYIVTDEDRLFESIAQELPERVAPVRLYAAYLRNFEIESGRGLL